MGRDSTAQHSTAPPTDYCFRLRSALDSSGRRRRRRATWIHIWRTPYGVQTSKPATPLSCLRTEYKCRYAVWLKRDWATDVGEIPGGLGLAGPWTMLHSAEIAGQPAARSEKAQLGHSPRTRLSLTLRISERTWDGACLPARRCFKRGKLLPRDEQCALSSADCSSSRRHG